MTAISGLSVGIKSSRSSGKGGDIDYDEELMPAIRCKLFPLKSSLISHQIELTKSPLTRLGLFLKSVSWSKIALKIYFNKDFSLF